MQLSETVRLYPTEYEESLILNTMHEYIDTVNGLVSAASAGTSLSKLTTAGVDADLPSALKNQCIRDAKTVLRKHYKACHKAVLKNRKAAAAGSAVRVTAPAMSVLKKLCFYVNSQNFSVTENRMVSFPVMINGKSQRIPVRSKMTDRQVSVLSSHKPGMLRIVLKNGHVTAQFSYEVDEPVIPGEGNVMGVDLGIKCPAVSCCSDGSVKFYGNGRKNKYMRRHYAYLRRKAQQAKKMSVVERIGDREQRIMRDLDHKMSHDIVATAVAHNVSVIKMEQLSNIRSTTRKSRKNNHSLHTWSFYRLAKFIEYKAKLAGIAVEYVNPAYTSQRCPVCGELHHADDRHYVCDCGFHSHRDIVGARNICDSTEYAGKRRTA